jgi:hypothetical protein
MRIIKKLLKQKMTRREFLVRLFVLLVIFSGITGTFEKLKSLEKPKKRTFGGGAYGA